MEKDAQPKVQGAESVTSGTTGNRCEGINQHRIGEPSLHLESNLKVGYYRKKQVKTRCMLLERQILTDELCFETIHIDSSNVNLVRDEAFAKIPVELPNVDHPNPVLKVKVDTSAQGNKLFCL